MLYYKFKNYDEFKTLFGRKSENENEKSVRKNKILLTHLKNKELLHQAITTGDYNLLWTSDMAELKEKLNISFREAGQLNPDLSNEIILMYRVYRSAKYATDEFNGICEDCDYKSIRYINSQNGKIYKMKAGKFYRALLLETEFGKTLSEAVLNYLCEEFSADWQSYCMTKISQSTLYVDTDFEKIYSSQMCKGDFGSCMVNKGYHFFYEDSVKAKAAYLQNEDNLIVARCVIYTQVKDQDGKIWRLAERQYSSGCDDLYKRLLIDALIKGNHIDGYKKVGAGCGEPRAFVDIHGESLRDMEFRIDCDLGLDDVLSYQDSFKWYNECQRIATNYGVGEYSLEITDGSLNYDEDDEGVYDDWHDYYTDSTTRVYYQGREYQCNSEDLSDFTYVESLGEYYYNDEVEECGNCGVKFLKEGSEARYSEITEEYYDCQSCLEEAEQDYKEKNWYYCEYDEIYVESIDDIAEYEKWNSIQQDYRRVTISRCSLDELLSSGEFIIIEDLIYEKQYAPELLEVAI